MTLEISKQFPSKISEWGISNLGVKTPIRVLPGAARRSAVVEAPILNGNLVLHYHLLEKRLPDDNLPFEKNEAHVSVSEYIES